LSVEITVGIVTAAGCNVRRSNPVEEETFPNSPNRL